MSSAICFNLDQSTIFVIWQLVNYDCQSLLFMQIISFLAFTSTGSGLKDVLPKDSSVENPFLSLIVWCLMLFSTFQLYWGWQ